MTAKTTDIRASILVPICPHCSTEVKESEVTPGWAFCSHKLCRKGPWMVGSLPTKKVYVKEVPDGTS